MTHADYRAQLRNKIGVMVEWRNWRKSGHRDLSERRGRYLNTRAPAVSLPKRLTYPLKLNLKILPPATRFYAGNPCTAAPFTTLVPDATSSTSSSIRSLQLIPGNTPF